MCTFIEYFRPLVQIKPYYFTFEPLNAFILVIHRI